VSAGLEIELKLRADDGALRRLASASALGPAGLGRPRPVDELDAYLDTADGRLAAAGWACRLRSRDGRRWISLKGPAEHAHGDDLHRRPEVEGAAPDGDAGRPDAWPPSPARDLARRLAGDAPLRERLVLRQHRIERTVLLENTAVGTLSLDRVRVEVAGSSRGGFAVVELEAALGVDAGRLDATLEALRAVPGLTPEPLSKLERALLPGRGATGAIR
jgi:inorganic triphosphatase YgiF